MAISRFEAYLQDTLALSRSLCIKSEQSADVLNQYLAQQGIYVDPNAPETWKYYLNLAGQYHSTDSVIQVVSSDTRDLIDLTVDNLVNHPVTRKEYGPRGIYHDELLKKHPLQRDLILRIFNPIDLNTAIEADDFTLLYYDDHYVANRERSIMHRLQKWLTCYDKRWNVRSFEISDALYPAAMLGVMYAAIPSALMAIRMELIKTEEVCDYHLWSYLGSRYRLDRFRNCLNDKQALYLYRNIEYLRHNVGKEFVIKDLFKNITEPMGVYGIRYDLTQAQRDLTLVRKGQALAIRNPYDVKEAKVGVDNRRDLDFCYGLTKPKAKYNEVDYDMDVPEADDKVISEVIDTVPTGLVELEVRLPYYLIRYSPEQIALNQFFRYVAEDRYRATYKVPFGGFGEIRLDTANIALLLVYCYNALNGAENLLFNGYEAPDNIPNVLVDGTVSEDLPTPTTLRSIYTNELVEGGFAESTLDAVIEPEQVYDADALMTLAKAISKRYFFHTVEATRPYSINESSYLWSGRNRIYTQYLADISNGYYNFGDWAAALDLPLVDLTDTDLNIIISFILEEVIGIVDNQSLDNCHRSASEILKLLTNYGVIFVEGKIDESNKDLQMGHKFPISSQWALEQRFYLDAGLIGLDSGNGLTSHIDVELPNLVLGNDGRGYIQNDLLHGLTMDAELQVDVTHLLVMGLEPGPANTEVIDTADMNNF